MDRRDRNPAAHPHRRKGFEVVGQGRGAMRLTLR
jgi:hypothetical protein